MSCASVLAQSTKELAKIVLLWTLVLLVVSLTPIAIAVALKAVGL